MTMLGADTQMLRAQAELMRAGAVTLRGNISGLGSAVRSVAWAGPDAETFRAEAESAFSSVQRLLDDVDRRSRELDEHAIVVSSFSKYWGMTGWRLGWLLVPEDLREAVDALAGNIALCPPAAAQEAAVAAFSEESYRQCEAALVDFGRAREVLLARVPELGWGAAAPADGAFYYWADLGEQLAGFADAREYATALLEATGVAVTPGGDFDPVEGSRCVRLSLAAGPDPIAEALDRIIAWQRSRG